MEIGTIDTSELHSVKALLDSGATKSFIDRDFVHSKGINTQTLLHNIPVFNVNSSPNKVEQISEVIDILLYYKTHSERMLLAVSGLGKQSLILGYNWLKDHNPKVDWEKGEVEITHCPLWCEKGRVLQKCHKLHSAISPSILHQFSRSQWLRKALEKTFRSVPVTSRGDQ